ncbi:hypothetical protein STIAU_8008 [Stigmatella aurantiaca DW4/3-1]|uniref:Uncharacterized protein n=1 Tax=Stigmatella aurantiaca (strain DW4/3-1) TaxID=378806 RepID=Q09C29_STIAD|nr:hypothetical protein STIAU_8008 [Stigmatella aurantiaca DW4/3-1]
MDDERLGRFRSAPPQAGEHRVSLRRVAARDGQEATGFVDGEQPGIFIDEPQRIPLAGGLSRREGGIHPQALQHVGQDPATLAVAGRVVQARVPFTGEGRGPPPELGEGQRFQVVAVGLRQELGRGAVSRAAGGRLGGEQGAQGLLLAASVRNDVVVGNLLPELPGALGAQVLDRGAARIDRPECRHQNLSILLVRGVQPAALIGVGAALLAERVKRGPPRVLLHHPLGQMLTGVVAETAVRFVALPKCGGAGAVARGQRVEARAERNGLGALEQLRMSAVQGAQLGFARGPEGRARGLIEERWRKPIDVPAAIEHAREAAEVADAPIGRRHGQHAEHLAASRFLEVLETESGREVSVAQARLQRLGSAAGQRVGGALGERVRETRGHLSRSWLRIEIRHGRLHRRGSYQTKLPDMDVEHLLVGGIQATLSTGRRATAHASSTRSTLPLFRHSMASHEPRVPSHACSTVFTLRRSIQQEVSALSVQAFNPRARANRSLGRSLLVARRNPSRRFLALRDIRAGSPLDQRGACVRGGGLG